MKRLCEVDRSLTAEGSDNTVGLFELNNVDDIFRGQRFEVQLVSGGVVGRNGFGVVVDDYSLVT